MPQDGAFALALAGEGCQAIAVGRRLRIMGRRGSSSTGVTDWAALWTQRDLDLKTRTLVCVSPDAATSRYPELAIHLRIAAREGWTEQELVEVLLFFTVLAGGGELLDRPFNMRRPAVHIHGHLGSRTPSAAPSPECWDG